MRLRRPVLGPPPLLAAPPCPGPPLVAPPLETAPPLPVTDAPPLALPLPPPLEEPHADARAKTALNASPDVTPNRTERRRIDVAPTLREEVFAELTSRMAIAVSQRARSVARSAAVNIATCRPSANDFPYKTRYIAQLERCSGASNDLQAAIFLSR